MVRAALLIGCLALSLPAADSSRLLADFEGADALAAWTFRGASLAIGPGHAGQGAILTYRFACAAGSACGGTAAATWTPARPLAIKRRAAISLWVRAAPAVSLALLVSGRNEGLRRYAFAAATLEHAAGEWRRVVIPLAAKSTGYWDQEHDGAPARRVLSIAIEAEARYPQALTGSVAFDELRVLDSPDRVFELLPGLPLSPAPPNSSKLAARLGVNVHRLEDPRLPAEARDAGFGFVRADLLWRQAERNGRYRFVPYDRLLSGLEAQGLAVLWILDYGHPQHGGNGPRTPEDIAAFGRFAAAVAGHFKGHNARYEIWNEPDTDRFWPPHPDPREYAALLREAVASIHQADPAALVSSGGVSQIDLPFLAAAAASGMGGVNAVAVHPYRRAAPETLAAELPVLRDFLGGAIKEPVEIWDTEWGYASYDYFSRNLRGDGHSEPGRHRQAVLGCRELLTVWSLGLPLAVWYDLRDDGGDPGNPEHNYGLLDVDGADKPAATAFRMLAATARDRTFAGMVRDVPDGVHAMRLDGKDGPLFVVWNDQPDARIALRLPKDGNASLSNLMGGPVQPKGAQVALAEADGPVYVQFR